MNQTTLIGLIALIGFLVILGLVIYKTDQKMKEYLLQHPEKAGSNINTSLDK